MKRIGIISQARLGSTRLPGKILKKVASKTLFEYHLDRLKSSNLPIIVATTVLPGDDAISAQCKNWGVPVVRGSEADVLSRYHDAVLAQNLDVAIRVTSDCPLIDGELIAKALKEYLDLPESLQERVYFSNTIDRTYARGFDFEIFSGSLLKEAFLNDQTQAGREHVTPYFYLGTRPDIKIIQIRQPHNHSHLRVTVDEQNDFDLIERLILDHDAFRLNHVEIEKLLLTHPELARINSSIEQKKI